MHSVSEIYKALLLLTREEFHTFSYFLQAHPAGLLAHRVLLLEYALVASAWLLGMALGRKVSQKVSTYELRWSC